MFIVIEKMFIKGKNQKSKMEKQLKTSFLSIVIAAFNERENIEELTLRIEAVMKKIKMPYELIYVLAGTDGTLEKVQQLQKKIPEIRYHYNKEPGGLGNDFKKGFAMVSPKSDYVVTMDADLNHHPEEIPQFIEEAKRSNVDVVIGSRQIGHALVENIPAWKKTVSKIANVIFYLLTRMTVKDKTSGYRLYKREVIQDIAKKMRAPNFECVMEIILIAAKQRRTFAEIPIRFTYRIHGKSKMNLIKTVYGYLLLLMKVVFRRIE